MTQRVLAALALLLLATAAPGAAGVDPGECATCHPRAGVLWQAGVHAKEEIPCVGCHRGSAEAQDADLGHHGMRWFREPEQIAATCGGCHAQAAEMRPFNLAVDQLALYRESTHGRARLAGNPQAPVCTDCHENHRVLAGSDTASPAFAANLTQTCGRCHANEALTADHGLEVGVVNGFSTSPHGRALQERRTAPGPSCSVCHDTHGAAVPRNTQVDEVCGGCHEEIRARFRVGSHQGLLEREDLAGCASCHPVHQGLVAKPLDAICRDCHSEDSSQVALGGDLARMLRAAHDEVAKAELAVSRAQRVPLAVRDHEALVADARRYLSPALRRLHVFRRDPVEQSTRAASSLALQVQSEIEEQFERRSSVVGLLLIWFHAALTLGVLAYLRRRVLRGGSS